MKLHKNRFLASSLFISLSLLPSAHAATGTWSGGVGDTWNSTATNWTGVTETETEKPWDSTNGENNNAIFNLASLAAPVSGTVYTNGITFNTGGTINAGGTITMDGSSPFLSAASAVTGVFKSNLAGTSGFTKTGAGTILINNATANTLTGEIIINAGQLTIQPSANVAAIASTASLVMSGSNLSLLAGGTGAATTRSQTFAGTTFGAGHSAASINKNTGDATNPATINFGTITRNVGATVSLSYTGAITTDRSFQGTATGWGSGATINDSGVVYATTGQSGSTGTTPRFSNDWAAYNGTAVVAATYTASTATTLSGNANVSSALSTTLASGATITSLRFSHASARTVTITSGNLTTGGILVSSGVGAFTSQITGGTLRSAATVANKDLVIINNNTSGGLVIASTIANAAAGSTGLTKSGAGNLVVTSDSNSYTGETRINEGTLRIGNNSTTGALSTLSAIVNNGILELSRTVELTQGTHFSNNISGTGRLDVSNSTVAALNTSNTFSGGVSIPGNGVVKLSHGNALGTGTLSIGDGSGSTLTARLGLSNDISVANAIAMYGRGSSTSDGIRNTSGNNTLSGTITLFAGGGTGYIASDEGLLTLGTTGSTAVTVGTTGRTLVLRGAGNGNVAGAIQNNGSLTIGVTKDGAGTWTLSDTNNYTGATSVTGGALVVNGSLANTTTTISGGTLVVNGNISTSTTTVQANGTLAGIGTVGGVTVGANGTLAIGSSPGTMTFAGDLGLSADSISNFEINDFTLGNHDLAKAATAGTQTVGFNGGTLNLLFQSGFNTTGSVTIFDFDAYSGTGFTSVVSTGLASGYTASFNAANGMVTVIPEPGAALLGGLGMLALLRRRRA